MYVYSIQDFRALLNTYKHIRFFNISHLNKSVISFFIDQLTLPLLLIWSKFNRNIDK